MGWAHRLGAARLAPTLLLAFGLGLSPGALGAEVPAFPGAVGFGALASGGRGGDVYHVTHLGDSGVGSLRDGIESAVGPRTIVFEVGGTIDLSRPLVIARSSLTIAGQTAPGGIGTRGYPVQVSGATDVVIRFVRFRTGDLHAQGTLDKPPRGNGDLAGDAADALSLGHVQRVMLDHVSASWGMDETLSVTQSSDVTLQHSIVSEGLDESHHPEGRHGYGSLLRGTGTGGTSIVGSLYAHHRLRSPAIGGLQDPPMGEPRPGLDIEIVNNVIYDWVEFPSHTVEGLGTTRLEFVGNVSIAGPSTLSSGISCRQCAFITLPWDVLESDELLIHRSGNLVDADQDEAHDPLPAEASDFPGAPHTEAPLPFDFSREAFEALDAASAYASVLDRAGASLWRDAIDRRIVAEVAMRAGGVIDSQEDVGGWPEPPGPPPGPAPEDVDRDGMADTWELSQGLDPTDSDDRNAHDLDAGYTNLEVYLDFRTIPVPEAGSVSSWLVVALLVGLRPRRKRPRLGHRDDQPAFPRP
jgi:hypothetical protein